MKKTGWLTSKTVRRHLSLKARIMKARPPHGLAPRPASHNAIFLAAEAKFLVLTALSCATECLLNGVPNPGPVR